MRFALALTIVLAGALPGIAEDAPRPAAGNTQDQPALTIRDVIGASGSLALMSCEKRVLKSGADEKVDCINYPPSVMKTGMVWQIAENRRKALGVVQQYQRLVNEHMVTLPRKENGDLADSANAEFQLFQADLLDKPAFLPGEPGLARFKKQEIDPLNLTPEVLTGLLPIIDR